MKKTLLPLMLIPATALLMGCATPVTQIARNPLTYGGKTMRIRGTPGRAFSIPLTEVTVFMLKGEKANVPVVALKKPQPGRPLVIRGTLWTFPKEKMDASAAKALGALENFLVEKLQVERERARKVAAPILAAVKKLSKGLGHFWFIIEQE